MKKRLSLSVLFLGIIFFINSAQAATYDFKKNSGITEIANKAQLKEQNPEFYVGLILNIFFSIIGLIFLVLIVFSGVKWMTAQGNTSRVDQAKDTITKAITGLVISLASYGITMFIFNYVFK